VLSQLVSFQPKRKLLDHVTLCFQQIDPRFDRVVQEFGINPTTEILLDLLWEKVFFIKNGWSKFIDFRTEKKFPNLPALPPISGCPPETRECNILLIETGI
jgi:hypothetical protein